MWVATEIPDPLLIGLAIMGVPLLASFLAWVVLSMGKATSRLDVKDSQDQVRDESLRDHEGRLRSGGL